MEAIEGILSRSMGIVWFSGYISMNAAYPLVRWIQGYNHGYWLECQYSQVLAKRECGSTWH